MRTRCVAWFSIQSVGLTSPSPLSHDGGGNNPGRPCVTTVTNSAPAITITIHDAAQRTLYCENRQNAEAISDTPTSSRNESPSSGEPPNTLTKGATCEKCSANMTLIALAGPASDWWWVGKDEAGWRCVCACVRARACVCQNVHRARACQRARVRS